MSEEQLDRVLRIVERLVGVAERYLETRQPTKGTNVTWFGQQPPVTGTGNH